MQLSTRVMSWLLSGGLLLGCTSSKSSGQPGAAHGGNRGGGGAADRVATGASGSSGAASGQAGAAGDGDASVFDDTRAPIAQSLIAADTTPAISDDDYATYIAHINQFGLALGQKMASENQLTTGNLIYSPLSVGYAMAMTYAGARGETASEMKTVLGDSFADGVFHHGANKLARTLASRVTSRPADSNGNAHRLEWSLVDSIFVEKTLHVQPAFLDVLGSEYASGVRQVDFRNAFEPARLTINDWVADQTKHKILDLLPTGSIDDLTRVVLVNALYFYGTWQTAFNADNTHDADFHRLAGDTIQVSTMSGELVAGYGKGTDYEVAELPYEGDHIRMTFVVPAAGQFENVRKQVSGAWLQQAVDLLSPVSVEFSLPKFKFTSGSFSLMSGLQDLGINEAFSGRANFTGISTDEPLKITNVFQKADVAVDENGTEAAAATGVIIGTSLAFVQPPPSFTIDRPFLFFIRDDSGAVLFSGQVIDPSM